jgi:hypothetical protein
MAELLKNPIHKSQAKLWSVQTINAKCGIYLLYSANNSADMGSEG